MEKMTAIINKNEPKHVILELCGGTEGVIKKKVMLKNFIKILTSSVDSEQRGITIGSLPNGYFNARIQEQDIFQVIVSIPAGVYPFQYFDSVYTIPFPRLVFLFRCEEGKTDGRCYAVKDDILTSDSELCHYPFSNVYQDGRICFGRNELPKCSKLSDVDALVRLFYGAPSNNDLWGKDYAGGKYAALRLFLEDLNGKDVFPVELLKPRNRKVSDLL